MDPQLKFDILFAMALAYGGFLLLRYWPRLQAKLLNVPFIAPSALRARLDDGDEDILIIDVRMPHEFNGVLGHIDGALNLQSSQLANKLETLGNQLDPYKKQRIVLTCQSNSRAPSAARILFQYGFSKISILDGGMKKWSRLK